ncbi:MAG: anti-sigma factor [Solirubrobacterales bacterium]
MPGRGRAADRGRGRAAALRAAGHRAEATDRRRDGDCARRGRSAQRSRPGGRPAGPAQAPLRAGLAGARRGAAATIAIVAVVALTGGSSSDKMMPGQVIARSMPTDASVRLYASDGEAHLKVSGMPKAGDGRIYEVWLQRPDDSMVATDALFDVTADGRGSVHVPDIAGAKAIYVTNEPAGGSNKPTTNPLMRVEITS